jgi:hypothetical protein
MTAPIHQRRPLPASDEAADVRRSAAGHDRAMDVLVLPAKPRHEGCGLIPLPRRHVQPRHPDDHILGAHQRAILAPCPASGQRRGTF